LFTKVTFREIADKLEVEKSKYELELDKIINKEQLIKVKYDKEITKKDLE
jgi:hypothetical protein